MDRQHFPGANISIRSGRKNKERKLKVQRYQMLTVEEAGV